jgi:Leucine-rich repeat (LRR) protein
MGSLQDLYLATNGDDWTCGKDGENGNTWAFSDEANPCEDDWYGVECIYGPPQEVYRVSALKLSYCFLSGYIPASIGILTNLTALELSDNSLSHIIPDVFGAMTNLSTIDLSWNELLRGPIPTSLVLLPNIEVIILGGNGLSGHIDTAFDPAVQRRLKHVSLHYNKFSGSVPETLLQNLAIRYLDLGFNHFWGTIPTALAHLPDIEYVGLFFNHLHGTIPDVFHNMSNLEAININYNYLSGALPSSLAMLPNLRYLDVSYNKLSGRVDAAMDPAVQTNLDYVVLSGNEFTGVFPSVLLRLPAIGALQLSYNCFSGTLPNAICSSETLWGLGLSCLSCSRRCSTRLVDWAYTLVDKPVHGTIPSCIFSMSNMEYIDLSHNYLTGTLPSSSQLSHPMSIDVSNNGLTGTIPQELGPGTTTTLLSNNRLTGTIPPVPLAAADDFFDSYSDFEIAFNRISGPVLGAEWPTSKVVVLTGNILACNNGDRSRLPAGDPAYDSYSCGSDNFNKPIIAWLCITVGLVILCCGAWYCRHRLDAYVGITQVAERVALWRAALIGQHLSMKLPNLARIRAVVRLLDRVAVVVALVALFLLAPIYAGLTAVYGTYNHQYAWTLSSVLLSGPVPFAVCFVLFLLALGLSAGALFSGHESFSSLEKNSCAVAAGQTKPLRIISAATLYLVANFSVVGVVNISYVATSLYTSAGYQLGISAFKVGWNLLIAPYLSRLLAYELSAARADWFTLELFVSIMNNIGIPLLAMVLVNQQCLFDLLGRGIAIQWGLAWAPPLWFFTPFHYSYQCSYVFMDFYSAAFLYAGLIASFGAPLMEQAMLQLYKRLPRGSVLCRCVDLLLPRILKPVETDPGRIPDRSVLFPFFDTTQFLVAQLTSLSLILTMGIVFPPLALPVAVTMVVSGYIETLKVGRLLTNASEEKQHKYLEIIEQECANVATPTTMRRAFWMLLWFGCGFYTLFLFDTLGDAVGFYAAYWVMIIVPLLPLVALVAYYVYLYRADAWAVALYASRRMRGMAKYVVQSALPYTSDLNDEKAEARVTPAETPVAEVEMGEKPAGL